MPEFLQILHESYRTEHYGPWHTRECYPWEYEAKAQECIRRANTPTWIDLQLESKHFFLQQAKILQDRADYIRQVWAEREASQVKQTVTRKALQAAQAISPTPHTPQSDPPPTQQPNSLAKKKRNQRTRKQYKQRKAQAQRVTVQEVDHMQEMEHSYGQEMEYLNVQIGVKQMASKHVFLQCIWECWHAAAIQWDALISGMIMVQNGVIWMPRIGVG